MAIQARLVFTSVPDETLAASLAQQLVESGLAACVKSLPACRATYRWEGKIEHTVEVPLVIVTQADCYDALEHFLKQAHPYDIPEILAADCSAGLPEYLQWVARVTSC